MHTHQIIGPMAQVLFEAEQRRLNSILIRINEQNKMAKRVSVDGFQYEGDMYYPRGVSMSIATGVQPRTPLDNKFWDEFETYLRDGKTVVTDMVQIRQTLFQLINPCTCDQDIRDTLPDFLAELVPPYELMKLDRSNEPGWTLTGNARAVRQYEKILPRMEFYAAARLIY